MSEEILRALMQLFAIITKQDEGAGEKEKLFVETFLKQQLNAEMVSAYLDLYESFLGKDSSENEEDIKKKKLTSVKDSVKTLSICKKINKTLTQKQKIIVLIRLFELIDTEIDAINLLSQRKEIINTVATVFNILSEDFESIERYCQSKELASLSESKEILLVGSGLKVPDNGAKYIENEIDGIIAILHVKSEDMYFLRYQGTGHIHLNGLPIFKKQINLFAYGSTIKLPKGEPIYYSDIHAKFLSNADIPNISFEAENLYYQFPNGHLGLQNINLSEGPGKLIAIMGGSGAGKTTLLNVLAGLEPPSKGSIKVNGLDLWKDKKSLEGVIGYVAQDDILFEELTVFQNLYYNAKLCFSTYSEAKLIDAVVKTLKSLGLYEIRHIKVGNVLNKKISGGQRKRLNIALELIREPAILFLDEPTSGLSSRDSENVIDLLKELTLKGKLIFVVIHQPSSDIYKMFDKVIILDVGGYQIYYGNPVQAVSYFKKQTNQINADEGQCPHCGNVNPEQIFNTIDAKVVDEYGNLTETRKVSPKLWEEYYQSLHKTEVVETAHEKPPKTLRIPNKIVQWLVFLVRDVLSKVSNTQYLLINLLEAPLLAGILSFIIRYTDDPNGTYFYGQNENIPAYLFMAIIVALFMGLTVSAEEIIRDAKILKRESFLNLSRFSYLSSKVMILFTLSAIQTLCFALIGNFILEIKGMYFSYWLMLFSLSCLANVMGLNISSTFNSAVTIYILIPILLIPQMILSGAIFSFDKLNKYISSKEKVPIIADFMASRWAFEGLAVRQFKENTYEKVFYIYNQKESEFDYLSSYWCSKMQSKLDEILYTPQNQSNQNHTKAQYDLLNYEFKKIWRNRPIPGIVWLEIQSKLDNMSKTDILYLKNIVDIYKNMFAEQYIQINERKDKILSNFTSTPERKLLLEKTKSEYYNESLADLVKNQTAKNKIIEYKGHFVQIKDPVYKLPEMQTDFFSFRTHLYAPVKPVFGSYWDTFWLNIAVIWIMTVTLFILLYFDFFKKLLHIPSLFSILLIKLKSKS